MIDSITEVEYDFRFKVNIALGCIAQTSAFPISKPARTFSYEQYLSLLRKGDWEKQRDRERQRRMAKEEQEGQSGRERKNREIPWFWKRTTRIWNARDSKRFYFSWLMSTLWIEHVTHSVVMIPKSEKATTTFLYIFSVSVRHTDTVSLVLSIPIVISRVNTVCRVLYRLGWQF